MLQYFALVALTLCLRWVVKIIAVVFLLCHSWIVLMLQICAIARMLSEMIHFCVQAFLFSFFE